MPTDVTTSELKRSTLIIPVAEVPQFEKKLASLSKKSTGFGLAPIAIISEAVRAYYMRQERLGDEGDIIQTTTKPLRAGTKLLPDDRVVDMVEIEIEYPIVKIGNWKILAYIENLSNEQGKHENLVFTLDPSSSAEQIAEQYRNEPIKCDHCKKDRYRRQGYLLKDAENDAVKEVGSTCLEDFTGIDPGQVLFLAQLYTVVRERYDDEDMARTCGHPTEATEMFLAKVLFLARETGFVSVKAAREGYNQPTWSRAAQSGFSDISAVLNAKWRESFEAYMAEAREVRQALMSSESTDNYTLNVKALLANLTLRAEARHLAVVAGCVPVYLRQKSDALAAASSRPSAHVGEVGKKLSMTVRVERTVTSDTQYGLVHRVLLRSDEGDLFLWKTQNTKGLSAAMNLGRQFAGTAKVKAHSEYRDAKQTEVTHVKVSEWLTAPSVSPNERGFWVGLLPSREVDGDSLRIKGAQLGAYIHEEGGFVARIPDAIMSEMKESLKPEELEALNEKLFWINERLDRRPSPESIRELVADTDDYCVNSEYWDARWRGDQECVVAATDTKGVMAARREMAPSATPSGASFSM